MRQIFVESENIDVTAGQWPLDVGGGFLAGVGTAARRIAEVIVLGDVEDVPAGGFGHRQRIRRRPELVLTQENLARQHVGHEQQSGGHQHEDHSDDDHHQGVLDGPHPGGPFGNDAVRILDATGRCRVQDDVAVGFSLSIWRRRKELAFGGEGDADLVLATW